jgi:hypothetical protein
MPTGHESLGILTVLGDTRRLVVSRPNLPRGDGFRLGESFNLACCSKKINETIQALLQLGSSPKRV